tara:strand:+ start:507 stop:1517 length:1011 start_codon:yes stop_codon:yes gene_type:complete
LDFTGKHILSVDQFDRDSTEQVFKVADEMQVYAARDRITRVLEGAILSNMFFEPSTRTRVSFGSAFNLLGGEVRETTEVKDSSLTKGESLYDTARVLSGYSDIIVMRHPQEGSVSEFSEASRVPVINGGDGANEHPSQALLDLYTMKKELADKGKTLDGLRIALIGDLKNGRAVHSLCKLLAHYKDITFNLIAPQELDLSQELEGSLIKQGHKTEKYSKLEEGIKDVEIVYVTRTQEERFSSQDDADKYRGLFRLNESIYTEHCAPNTVIMHPLPRDSRTEAQELDADMNQNPNLAIFRQADNGVVIRMALFALVLDVVSQVHNHSQPVTWFNTKR